MGAIVSAVTGRGRRRHPRVSPEPGLPVLVDINGEDFIDVLKARDVSEGGVGIAVDHGFRQCRLDADVEVLITLPPPVQASIHVSARIRHKSAAAFGVEFLGIKHEDRAILRRYVRHRQGSVWKRLKDRLQARTLIFSPSFSYAVFAKALARPE